MEQARRSALAHHVHRTAPMGPRVLINGIWYEVKFLADAWVAGGRLRWTAVAAVIIGLRKK